ncbi:thioester-containing protein, partial [Anopheles darlingi]
MVPGSNILVASVVDNVFVYDIVTINSEHLANTIELKRANAQHELRPDSTINIIVNGRPKSYVALASYDRSLLELGKDHDISNLKWEDVLKLFNEHDGAGATSLFE